MLTNRINGDQLLHLKCKLGLKILNLMLKKVNVQNIYHDHSTAYSEIFPLGLGEAFERLWQQVKKEKYSKKKVEKHENFTTHTPFLSSRAV